MTELNGQPEVRVIVPHTLIAPWITEALRKMRSDYEWRHEADLYAEAEQTQPAWADSEALGLCPMVCPDHQRHCDAYGYGSASNLGHTDPHACSLCEHWRQRRG